MSRYIVGQGEAPEWAAKRMMCFQRLDGGVGLEIETGRNNTKRLYEGDIVVDKGDFVQVIRNTVTELSDRRFRENSECDFSVVVTEEDI